MKKLRSYDPDKPYTIKSGKREGKSLGVLMFNEYSFLRWHFGEMEKRYTTGTGRNDYHRHLIWILKRGEDRKPKMECPVCGQRKVKYFSVRFSRGINRFSVSSQYTCCQSNECKKMLRAGAFSDNIHFYQPKFSNVTKLTNLKGEQKKITDLYRKIFKLEGRMTKNKAFNFFKE